MDEWKAKEQVFREIDSVLKRYGIESYLFTLDVNGMFHRRGDLPPHKRHLLLLLEFKAALNGLGSFQ
jgi:hypothetical protein